jgi:hypothetical protein
MIWKHGTNKTQEYFHPLATEDLQVVRELNQKQWTVYDFREDTKVVCTRPTASEAMKVVEEKLQQPEQQ